MIENKEKNLLNDSPLKSKKNGVWEKIKSFGAKKSGLPYDLQEDSSEVNFIADAVVPAKEVRSKLAIAGILLLGNILAVIFIYATFIIKEKVSLKNIKELEDETLKLEEQINVLKNEQDKIFLARDNIILAGDLLDKHIYWDKFFKTMEENTVIGIQYDKFNADITGQVKLDAVAQDFNVLRKQLDIFTKESGIFNSAEIFAISADQDKKTGKMNGISFSVSVNANPEIFYRKE